MALELSFGLIGAALLGVLGGGVLLYRRRRRRRSASGPSTASHIPAANPLGMLLRTWVLRWARHVGSRPSLQRATEGLALLRWHARSWDVVDARTLWVLLGTLAGLSAALLRWGVAQASGSAARAAAVHSGVLQLVLLLTAAALVLLAALRDSLGALHAAGCLGVACGVLPLAFLPGQGAVQWAFAGCTAPPCVPLHALVASSLSAALGAAFAGLCVPLAAGLRQRALLRVDPSHISRASEEGRPRVISA